MTEIKKDNPYNILKNQHSGKNYSIMHDGIQKFSKELNGVFVRTLSEHIEIVNVPWALKEIKGGPLNVEKLVDHVNETIISIHPLPNHENAHYEISSLITPEDGNLFPEKPPDYFKACKLLYYNKENKIIALEMPNWPVVINAEGCSVNVAAGEKLTK